MNKPLSIEDVALLCQSHVISIASQERAGTLTGWVRVPGGYVSSHEAYLHVDPIANANAVAHERNKVDHIILDAEQRGEAIGVATRKADHDAAKAALQPFVDRLKREREALAAAVASSSDVRSA